MNADTIFAAAAKIQSGLLDPQELVEQCLKQIDRLDERIHAWVLVDRQGARRAAAELSALAKQGRILGPLHGIPLGIKDIIDVQGMPTLAGADYRRQWMAPRDAPLVSALRRQGAIILGKTVTTQFACFDPPPTRNPWNLGHTPGGSSSGSAAGVALGMCWAALGSQTGGSISRPASYCGIVGFKPTWTGQLWEGVVPVSFHLDHVGVLTRSVEDAKLLALSICPHLTCSPPTGNLDISRAAPRFGVLEEFFCENADAEVRELTGSAIDRLRAAGAVGKTVELPKTFARVHEMHRRVMAVEAAEYHNPWFDKHRPDYLPKVAALIEEGREVSKSHYVEALLFRLQFQQEMRRAMSDVDLAICPATPSPAPADRQTTGDPSFNSPWSFAGVPTITLPCGVAENRMPCSLQLVGQAGADLALLQWAQWSEPLMNFRLQPDLRDE